MEEKGVQKEEVWRLVVFKVLFKEGVLEKSILDTLLCLRF